MDRTHKPRFPFFEFAREIRDLIYWHAVVNHEPLELHGFLKAKETSLFRVCKRIHGEAIEIFYKGNVFYIPIQLFTVDQPVDRILAGPLYRLPTRRLATVTKMDIDLPVSSIPREFDARKILRRLTTFVGILAASATPKLQLRFFCLDLLEYDSLTALDIFGERSAKRLAVGPFPPLVLDGAITNDAALLQLLRLALRKTRRLLGKVQMHVTVLVHPAFLRKAKTALMLHGYQDYLLIGDLDPASKHTTSEVLGFLQSSAIPDVSPSTVQTVVDDTFFECPVKDLEPNKAWMWRTYYEDAGSARGALEACRDAAKIQNKLPANDAPVSTT